MRAARKRRSTVPLGSPTIARLGCFQPGPVMKKVVWGLLVVAIVSWGICYRYPTNTIHFGWIGTLFASTAGLTATISSYQTEEVAHTRGGTIYKSRVANQISADLCFARATTCRFFACQYPRQPGPIWGEVTASFCPATFRENSSTFAKI